MAGFQIQVAGREFARIASRRKIILTERQTWKRAKPKPKSVPKLGALSLDEQANVLAAATACSPSLGRTLSNGVSVDLRTDDAHLLASPLEDWACSYRVGVFLESLRYADPDLVHAFAGFVCARWVPFRDGHSAALPGALLASGRPLSSAP